MNTLELALRNAGFKPSSEKAEPIIPSEGNRLCKGCMKEIPKEKLTCSDQCYREAYL